jgi:hypothetical protein
VTSSLRVVLAGLRLSAPPILQSAAAAAAAWFLAGLIPGHDQPVFAPVTAMVALGVTVGRRGRQAVELVLGTAFGIAVADLLVRIVGSGALQIALVSGLAMTGAALIRQSPLFISQAGVWAILVVAVERQGGLSPDRLVDALIGGGVALVMSQVLFPANPVSIARGAAGPLFRELADALGEVLLALDTHDRDRLQRLVDRLRGVDERVDDLRETVGVVRETARLAPSRRRVRGRLEPYAAAADQLDLAVGNVRVLASAALRLVREETPPSRALLQAIRDLAGAVAALAEQVQEPGRDPRVDRYARAAVERAGEALRESSDLATSVIVHQIESTAFDLVRGAGTQADDAERVLREPALSSDE